MPDRLLDSVRSLIARRDLIPPGSLVLVAVSGGQDSCALLHALAVLRGELAISLHAAHLDHGFRGEGAKADASFVRELAAGLGIPVTIEERDVPAIARRLHLSAQEAARRERHRFLDAVAERVGADRIALGHTRDDRIETILLNILRGTGLDGLVGLRPASGQRIRPLLEVSRTETAAYCAERGIPFRDDPSNRSMKYLRNRVREELLPLLETYYNPEVRQALLRLAALADSEAMFLREAAGSALAEAALNLSPGRAVLSVDSVRALPAALARRVLRNAIETVRGNLQDVDFATLDRVLASVRDAAQTGTAASSTLPGGDVCVRVDARKIVIVRRPALSSARRVEYALPLPGTMVAPQLGMRFKCEERERIGSEPVVPSSDRALFAAEAIRPPLTIRTRRPGDRIRPLGMAGTRKLQDVFTDAKVHMRDRDKVAVIADQEGILWVVGHVLSERARIGPETRRVTEIRAEPLDRSE